MAVKMKTLELRRLIERTQRIQNVGVRPVPQVQGTRITVKDGIASTCNIVRDGVTSIAKFSTPVEGDDCEIIVASIPLLLGALSKHDKEVSLTQKEGKLLIKSTGKQTTLLSDERAKAFSHTKKTIKEWADDSETRFSSAIETNAGKYTLSSGDIVEPCAEYEVDSNTFLNALNSGAMNNQKLNHYTLQDDGSMLTVKVGDVVKGESITSLCPSVKHEFATIIGGGLENVLRTIVGKAKLSFIDLTPHGGGISLIINSNDGVSLFQREVAGA